MQEVQSRVFFNKLAELGFNPTSDEDRSMYWDLANRLVQQAPSRSDAARGVKQASFDCFGEKVAALASDGYSLEAYNTVEELCRDEYVVKAAHILLAANNA